MKTLVFSATVIGFTGLFATIDGLQPIPTDAAQQIGKTLSDEADKFEKPQVKIAADPTKANGLHEPSKAGVLIVPQKELKEGEELAAKFKEEKGASLAYLFLYRLMPVVNGSPVDASRLRTVKLTDEGGQEHKVSVMLLAVRQLADDDYRLYGYGHEEKPMIDAKFSEGTGPGAEPVAVEIKDIDAEAKQGNLVVTVFGKYQASFKIGYRAE